MYRKISFISHLAKVVLRIINRRFETRASIYIGDNWFRLGRGRQQVMRMLVEEGSE